MYLKLYHFTMHSFGNIKHQMKINVFNNNQSQPLPNNITLDCACAVDYFRAQNLKKISSFKFFELIG